MKTRIREFREQKKMSQKELSNLVGVSRQTINYIELGKTSPKITVALKIAKNLGVSVEKLFQIDDVDDEN